jgi:hypothetical protein
LKFFACFTRGGKDLIGGDQRHRAETPTPDKGTNPATGASAMIRPALAAAALVLAALPASAQTPRSLPATMHGMWGYDAEACTNESSDGRVEVKARSVTFFASYCSFSRFRRGRDGAVTASGRCRGEGETNVEPGSVRLRHESPDRLLIALDGGEGSIHQRCERPLPVR